MSNIIAEKGINFAVYYEGEDQLGVAEGEFPTLEAMTSEVKGAGIAGVANTPVLGHFNSITMTLKWRNTTDAFVKLAAHKAHELDLYSAQQDYDAGVGEYREKAVHIFLRGVPTTSTMGNLVVGDSVEPETEIEVLYLKLEIDNKEKIELDKYNYIFKVDGTDYLTGVRSALGKQ